MPVEVAHMQHAQACERAWQVGNPDGPARDHETIRRQDGLQYGDAEPHRTARNQGGRTAQNRARMWYQSSAVSCDHRVLHLIPSSR